MAFLDDIVRARNAVAAEIAGECEARAAMVAAGQPPPVTYSVGGKSYQWNEWLESKLRAFKELNEMVIMMGGDGGLYEERIRGWT